MPGSLARTRDTVLTDTPAKRAISVWRGRRLRLALFISSQPYFAFAENVGSWRQVMQDAKKCKFLRSTSSFAFTFDGLAATDLRAIHTRRPIRNVDLARRKEPEGTSPARK